MKKITISLMIALIVLSACTTGQGAVTGASLGSMFGSALGGILGGPRGRDIGTMVGMVAGGAAGAGIGYHNENRRYDTKTTDTNRVTKRKTQREETTMSTTVGSEASYSPLTLRNLRFIGEDGNQFINRGETCKIIFELANMSGQTVYDVVPYVAEVNGNEHLEISPTTRIESIANGDAVRYTATVLASNRIKEGTAEFRIAVSTDGQEFVTLKDFSVGTNK